MKNNVLVTGAAGFIGSHVCEELAKSHNVVGLDDLSGGKIENVPDGVSFYYGSICDTEALETVFTRHKIDYVFHFAAYAAEGLSHFIRNFNYENNLIGSVNLINQAVKHNVKRFVFTSSMAVYGTNVTPLVETLEPQPEDPYGIAKYAVEMDLQAANELFGLNYVIFRPYNVYGIRQNLNDKYRNVIGIFMNQILSGKKMTIFGDGEQKRSFSYIDDIDVVIADSICNENIRNDIFNIGSTEEYTLNELANIVGHVSGVGFDVEYVGNRYEVKNAYCSSSKIRSLYKEMGDTSLIKGVEEMWEWAKTQKIEATKKFENIEITKNLPNVWK